MPINLYIDVDLTLIDKDGNLLPGVLDALQVFHATGLSLTLWSLGGVEYAKAVAKKHGIEEYFDGFAGKPDAVVDDDMDSLRPQLKFEMRPDCNWADMSARIMKELASLNGKPQDRRDVLALVEKCQADLCVLQQLDALQDIEGRIFHESPINLHPIPFFGHPFGAEILTMALNPAWTEFEADRSWPDHLDTQPLLQRLFGYFYDSPHKWFKPYDKAVLFLERSYLRDAAHVDPFPYPTKRLSEMSISARVRFGKLLLEKSPDHLTAVLGLCRGVKLILIRDYPLTGVADGIDSTFDLIVCCCPAIRAHVRDDGAAPPVLRLCAGDGLSEMIFGRRRELLDYLGKVEPMSFS